MKHAAIRHDSRSCDGTEGADRAQRLRGAATRRRGGLAIRNLGFGPALNVQIDSAQISGRSAVFEHPAGENHANYGEVARCALKRLDVGWPSRAAADGSRRAHGWA